MPKQFSKCLGYFCNKSGFRELSNIVQSGHAAFVNDSDATVHADPRLPSNQYIRTLTRTHIHMVVEMIHRQTQRRYVGISAKSTYFRTRKWSTQVYIVVHLKSCNIIYIFSTYTFSIQSYLQTLIFSASNMYVFIIHGNIHRYLRSLMPVNE